MDEEFKTKLAAYERGELSDEEAEEVEKDLERLEAYQSYFDETMGEESKASVDTKHFVRRGKWKARFQNAATVIGILLAGGLVITVITMLFYGLGEESKMEAYPKAIKAAVATTKPNLEVGSSGANAAFLHMNFNGELVKRVGAEREQVGELNGDFLLNMPNIKLDYEESDFVPFWYPEQLEDGELKEDQWERRLEQLPEGTVSELYISFSDYFSTDALLSMLKDRDLMPAWFAVDTGPDLEEREITPKPPIGFPYISPGLFMETEVTKKSGGFFFGVESGGGSYSVESYGDGKKRNEDFLNMLHFMNKYDGITEDIASRTKEDLSGDIAYIEENGVRIYGMVVTGPTKALLELKDEEWVGSALVGEVRLWNWFD
ncbi:anti-sigma factor [Pontibacillus salipaludis]|uniref:anti-sigma factor n=1 Tax=Pontibacillus salipaludis TaxID=1697394 RepID=UPI0031E6A206